MPDLNCYGKSLKTINGVLEVKGPTDAAWPLKRPQSEANGIHVDEAGGLWSHDYQLRALRPARSAPDDELYTIPNPSVIGDNRNWLGPDFKWSIRNDNMASDLIVHGSCAMWGVARGFQTNTWAEPLMWIDDSPPPAEGWRWPRVGGQRATFNFAVFFNGTFPFTVTVKPGQVIDLHRAVGMWVETGKDWRPGTESYVDLTIRTRAIGYLVQPAPTGANSTPSSVKGA
ncbi:hypothetical protein AB0J38_14440 [Streptomyces sp. NPDC050095]|uniref:hypothetical protein n=1 Tax=unclassified Streptomyces TaxID=2593676 RepID=UPI0034203BEA